MGKNYVCSDIHGMKGSYEEALKKLNEDDVLYILGDAIDRGDDGIEILIDIAIHSGENGRKPRVEYILGNHDLLFIENMETIMKHNIRLQNQEDFDLWDTFEQLCYQFEESRIYEGKSGIEEYQMTIEKVSWLKDVSFDEMKVLAEHIYNDGNRAIWYFLQTKEDMRRQLYAFLENCLIQKQLNIGGKKFILTHAAPIPVYAQDNQGITLRQARNMTKNGTTNLEKDRFGVYNYVYARGNEANIEWKKWLDRGYHTICGHTPSRGKTNIDKNYGRIIIDTSVFSSGGLALVNIDDGKLTMIETKGRMYGKEIYHKPSKYEEECKSVKDFFDSIRIHDKDTTPIDLKQNIYESDKFLNATIKDISGIKSGVVAAKEMIDRMESGEKPTKDDIEILRKLSKQKLNSNIYSSKDEEVRQSLLKWGGFFDYDSMLQNKNEISSEKTYMNTIADYEDAYNLTDINKIDKMIERLQKLREKLQKEKSEDKEEQK